MKTMKKVLVLLLAIVLVNAMTLPCFASVAPGTTEAKVGDVVKVSFSYAHIAGIRGTFTFSGDNIVNNITVEAGTGFEGKYNKETGILAYFAAEARDFTCTLNITLKDSAVAGDEVKIAFEYETTVDGKLPNKPDYKYDYATVKIGVDYTKLNAMIAKAEALNKDDYTQASWDAVADALEKAIAAKTSNDQSVVDAAANALEKAINALQKKPTVSSVDYSKLNEQIARAQALNKDDYTQASWNVVADALEKAIAAKTSTDQAVVDAAANALEKAINALEKKTVVSVDYSKLEEQIAIAQKLNKNKYTEKSWNALQDALTKAIAARKSTDQSVVDAATSALKAAIAALKTKPGVKVDYTRLNTLIETAQGLNEADYTPESWAVLQDALEEAIAARSVKVQAVVDAAATALENAINALVRKPVAGLIDYTKLNEQIERAQALDKDEYTSESWAALETALQEAIVARTATTQQEVDAATEKLRTAINSLVLKPQTNLAWIIIPIIILVAAIIILLIFFFKKKEKKADNFA